MSAPNHTARKLIITLVSIVVFVVGVLLLVLGEALHIEQPWRWLLDAIGGFLAISVLTSFLYSVTLRKIDDTNQKGVLQSLLNEQVERLIKGRARYGLDEFCDKMDFVGLFDGLQKGDELWWLDTYAPGHKQWIYHLGEALKRGATIRMLVIDPTSDTACLRANEIAERGFEVRRFLGEIDDFIDGLSDYVGNKSSEGGQLKIRKYSDLPCIPMYLVCRKATPSSAARPIYGYTSFFLTKATGVTFPHIRWQTGQDSLLDRFFDYIQQKWDSNNSGTFIVSMVSPRPDQEVNNNKPTITATFSNAVAYVTTDAFKLESVKEGIATPVRGKVKYESGYNKASFTPLGKLEPSLYKATITTDVIDLEATPLSQEHTWQFTVKHDSS